MAESLIDPEPVVLVVTVTRRTWGDGDVREALEGVSSRVQCVVKYEIGGGTGAVYDPMAVGDGGISFGPAMVNTVLLAEYLRDNPGASPHDPEVAIPWMAAKISEGRGRNWSPISRGLC